MGWLLDRLEQRLNQGRWRRAKGSVALAGLLTAAVAPATLAQLVLERSALGLIGLVLLAASLPAQRSLHRHVGAVADALCRGGLEEGRRAVAHIVGRDPAALDEAGVVRAAIESLAENFADGVVAPLFWGAVAGLGGMAGYKAANTADSMVGHRNARFERFGYAAARFDDLVNLPASRVAAGWIVLASGLIGADWRSGLRAVWRDAGRHRSPNAGWPEAAMAGALGLRLAGPRRYGGVLVDDAWMGTGRAAATVHDLRRALGVYRVACALQVAALALLTALG